MIIIRKPKANERSTYIINLTFTDEEGESAIPTSVKWTLCTVDETIINNREQVEVLVPASDIDIVLSGDDLAILEGEEDQETVDRYLVVEATYNSDHGVGLPLNEVAKFELTNFLYIE